MSRERARSTAASDFSTISVLPFSLVGAVWHAVRAGAQPSAAARRMDWNRIMSDGLAGFLVPRRRSHPDAESILEDAFRPVRRRGAVKRMSPRRLRRAGSQRA